MQRKISEKTAASCLPQFFVFLRRQSKQRAQTSSVIGPLLASVGVAFQHSQTVFERIVRM